MLILFIFSLLLTATFMAVAATDLLARRRHAISEELAEIRSIGSQSSSMVERHRRLARRERLMEFLLDVGNHVQGEAGTGPMRELLVHAGYRDPRALQIFVATRILLGLGLAGVAFMLTSAMGLPGIARLLGAVYFAAIGYVGPLLVVRTRRMKRQKDIQRALPDALDLLVVCVEAGLGLNQAMMRVAGEIGHVSRVLAQELMHVNAEVRAGAPRDQALRAFADRTGVEDVRSLTTMLIQTDRFGTSIGRSLRVHSDTLREKRRQRAEEAAAKTAIKLVFPLVLCIFPALFVVILGPGLILIFRALSGIS